MITLKEAVVAALVREAGHDDIDLRSRDWEHVKDVPGANEELLRSVDTELMLDSVERDLEG